MVLLASDITEWAHALEHVPVLPAVAALSVAVFVLAYLIRAVENYVRHLHRKGYLPYSNPRFILTTLGCILVADAALAGIFFEGRLPLGTATVAASAGLLCFIVSVAMSLVPYVREVRRLQHDSQPGDGADGGGDRDE